MEAGYDYLLLRGRLQRRFFNVSGIFVFVFGAILLATSGAYYGYAAKAHADLDSLNVTLPKTNAKISVGPGSQGSLIETQIALPIVPGSKAGTRLLALGQFGFRITGLLSHPSKWIQGSTSWPY